MKYSIYKTLFFDRSIYSINFNDVCTNSVYFHFLGLVFDCGDYSGQTELTCSYALQTGDLVDGQEVAGMLFIQGADAAGNGTSYSTPVVLDSLAPMFMTQVIRYEPSADSVLSIVEGAAGGACGPEVVNTPPRSMARDSHAFRRNAR